MRRIKNSQLAAELTVQPLSRLLVHASIIMVVMTLSSQVSLASGIDFMTHNTQSKVYLDPDGEMRGKEHGGRRAFNVELVREMMIMLNVPRKIKDVPFRRGLKIVQTEQDHALFNVTRTAEREHTVKWVGPLQEDAAYFYEMKDKPTGILTMEDAKKVNRICVVNGNVHDNFLTKKGFSNLVRNKDYNGCFKMLAKNRVDLTPSSTLTIPERLKVAGMVPDTVKRTPVILFKTEGHVAFSKNVQDMDILKWQNVLDQLKSSGRYEQLVQKYLYPGRVTKPGQPAN